MKSPFTLLLGMCLCTCLCAQEESYQPYPCGVGNPNLKELLKGAVIHDGISVSGISGPGTYTILCSSMLKSGGKAPVMPSVEGLSDEEKSEKREEFEMKYDIWSCQYSPAKLTDNNIATAWVEGSSTNGEGELVIAQVDVSKKVKIWAGYGKSNALFLQNSRPKKIRLHVIQTTPLSHQYGTAYIDLSLTASSSPVLLKDLNGFQDLPPLPVFENKNSMSERYEYWLGIEIIEVYPGTKFKDLCISEISN